VNKWLQTWERGSVSKVLLLDFVSLFQISYILSALASIKRLLQLSVWASSTTTSNYINASRPALAFIRHS